MATDDKLIKDKIDAIVELTDGYSPNLENKWDILQAALEQNREKKSRKLYWMRVSTAAVILMISGSLYLYFGTHNVSYPEATLQSNKITPLITQELKSSPTKIAVKRKQLPVHKPQAIVSIIRPETICAEESIQIRKESTQLVANTILPTEQPRFVEIDFFTPALSPETPTETLVKAHQFKFKFSIGENKLNTNAQNTPSNSIGLKTTF